MIPYNHPMPLTLTQRQALESTGCEIRASELDRVLYATDASIYRVAPSAVALPCDASQCAVVVRAAAEVGVGVTPRGAGTGLTGGAIGEGLIVDVSRRLGGIEPLDRGRRMIRVGAGVVLDRLNGVLAEDGVWFGPDVATSSRATLGGMIANNSSGAHAPVYGTTADHVEALEIVVADGTLAWVGRGRDGLEVLRERASEAVLGRRTEIERRLPADLVKRRPGYDFHRFVTDPSDLAALVAGSEGTLGLITSAILRVAPRPTHRGLGVVCFSSVTEAMLAMVELQRLRPAAVEHLDLPVIGQSRGRLEFAAARALLELDEKPCQSLLLVEFFDEVDDPLAELARLGLGDRVVICHDETEQEMVWQLRRAGLSLVTGCAGPAKPTTVIEDACVRPEDLPAFVDGMKDIVSECGGATSFYGHAASGLLHIRPTLDLHRVEDIVRLRQVAEAVSALVRRFGGSLAGEHGVGIARTEFLPDHLGGELIDLTAEVKRIFDPDGVMNPGKIVDTGRWKMDRDLRLGPGSELSLPFVPISRFVEKDRSFVGNLEQCNGCGGCLKDSSTMCPTYAATGEEVLSTRGRASVLRAALEGRFDGGVAGLELAEALGSCLSCKACKRECPSGVDLALLKAETLQARHREHGPSLADRVIAHSDLLGRLGSAMAPLSNAVIGSGPIRRLMQRVLGLEAGRPLPPFARQRFDRWFERRTDRSQGRPGGRDRVILWDDTWVRYHEPGIGRAAVEVLEAAGFEVVLAEGRRCCGRPAVSRGLLEQARDLGRHNVALLRSTGEAPIVFLEPSCWSTFVDEYRQFEIEGADEVAKRCVLFEDFVLALLDHDPEALPLRSLEAQAAIHGHCHAKALADVGTLPRLLSHVPGLDIQSLETGCCGMAGAFGLMAANQDLSRAVADPLVRQLDVLPENAMVVTAGASCRHQVRDLAGRDCLHPAELLADALVKGPGKNFGLGTCVVEGGREEWNR